MRRSPRVALAAAIRDAEERLAVEQQHGAVRVIMKDGKLL
jgi:hypothetical protein